MMNRCRSNPRPQIACLLILLLLWWPLAPTSRQIGAGGPPDPQQRLFLEMKALAKEYEAQMRAHHQALQKRRTALKKAIAAADDRLGLLAGAALTQQEHATLVDQLQQLRALTAAIEANQGQLGAEMTILRGRSDELDKEAMIANYEAALAVQAQRLQLVDDARALVDALAAA